MTVYVDNYKQRFGRMIMCHMCADTIEELHVMAEAIGMRRAWFQDRIDFPHYDVCKSRRATAVALGAVEITARQSVEMMKNNRKERHGSVS